MPTDWRAWGLAAALAGCLVAVHVGSVQVLAIQGTNELATVAQARSLIRQHYVEELPDSKIGYRAIRGMVTLLDPHSRFFDPEETAEFREGTSGHFGGLGFFLSIEDGLVQVIAPLEGTPAAEAGILPGDIIRRINGKTYGFKDSAEALKTLKGEPGTKIQLSVQHKDQDAIVDMELTRAEIKIDSVRGVELVDQDAKIGYLRIIAFQGATRKDVLLSLAKLVDGGARAIIIDLRSNPGGLLHSATDIADAFVDRKKLLVTTKGRSREAKPTLSERDPIFGDIPVAVLIDGGSASASEILAGALRDHKKAVLIGTRSYGKGSVQSVEDLYDGTVLKLTIAYYYTPSGRRIHRPKDAKAEDEWGLLPDIEVRLSHEERSVLAAVQAEKYVNRLRRKAGDTAKASEASTKFKDRVLEKAKAHLRAVLKQECPLVPAKPIPETPKGKGGAGDSDAAKKSSGQ